MIGRIALTLLFAAAVSGCASLATSPHYGPVGSRVEGGASIFRDQPAPFKTLDLKTAAIGWASSGGGSRAAYLNAAILREVLRSGLRIDLPGASDNTASLLEQIDFVSAVSGGSLAAAYFVTHLEALKADADSRAWDEYLNKMARNYRPQQWYAQGIFNPTTWWKVLFTNYNRSHIARDDYDGQLFRGKTIADLPVRPALYVNAFDVGNRVRFMFSNHFIDTGYYEPKTWTNQLGVPRDMTSANDLVFTHVNPRSVRLADAIYASSAFPFAYPNLALRHFGNKIAYQGNLIFLADGGLVDNSGLLTLFTQMRIEVGASPDTRLVLAVHVDASIDSFAHGTIFQRQGIEEQYAWSNTYFGHGRAAVEGAIGNYQGAIFKFLEGTGVAVDELILNYKQKLTRALSSEAKSGRTSWLPEILSGKLLLRPLAIGLRLRDIGDAYFHVWRNRVNGANQPDLRLARLFQEIGIPSGFDETRRGEWPAATFRALETRISEITTDFILQDNHRKVLDLVAYLLVHGKLAPALETWNEVARGRLGSR